VWEGVSGQVCVPTALLGSERDNFVETVRNQVPGCMLGNEEIHNFLKIAGNRPTIPQLSVR
jgi:hypothetical protein